MSAAWEEVEKVEQGCGMMLVANVMLERVWWARVYTIVNAVQPCPRPPSGAVVKPDNHDGQVRARI